MILYNSEIISRYTNSGAWGETTLIEYFKQNIKQYGHQTCLVDPTNKEELVGLSPRRLSYHELQKELNLPQHIVSLAELAAMTTENATLEECTGLKNMRPSANEVFTIQWTSGTEADAKGCPLTHNNQIFQGKCYQAHQRTRGRKSRIETPRRYRRCCSRNARRKTG